MARSGFLDRLTGEGPPPHDELARVMRNLESVLNTQAGYGYFIRDFGLGEYMEMRGGRALVETLTAEIQHEVEQREPRLRDVEVELRARDGALWLHFALTATLSGKPIALRLLFDTVSGRVRVEKKE
jgi:type VI secretion system protein